MTIVERGICKISALDSKGIGIGSSDTTSEVVKVSYTVPGDVIEFEKHSYRNKISFALSKIFHGSKQRVPAPCEYFTICGGCSLQHLGNSYYYQYKLENLKESFKKSFQDYTISPIRTIGEESRRRVIFTAVKKSDQVFLGFKKFRSHQIINIDYCLLIIPELSNLINKLKIILLKFLSDKEKCRIFVTKAANGIDLIIETDNKKTFSYSELEELESFALNNQIIRLTFIYDNRWHVVYQAEKPYIIIEGIKVEVDNHGFLQVSEKAASIFAELISNFLGKLKVSAKSLIIADLFCGRGTLTIPAMKFGIVDGFESDRFAVKALRNALKETEPIKTKIYERDLYIDPLQWDELNRYNVVLLNPPRAGALKQSEILAKSTIRDIIYFSCNPESFIRDANILLSHKRYKLKEIIPIDQFYWTPHLEIMGRFSLIGE